MSIYNTALWTQRDGEAPADVRINLDVHVYSELRRRARVREEKHEESTKLKRNLVQSAFRRRASARRLTHADAESGDDDELVGAVSDDDEADYVRKVISLWDI